MATSETCSRCQQEVRWGWRGGSEGYWHREAADHAPIFGRISTAADLAEVERQMDIVRERIIPCDPPFPLIYRVETYTARGFDQARYEKNRKYREAQERLAAANDETEEGHELEPIEVHSTPMPLKGILHVDTPTGSREVRVPGGVRTVLNLAGKVGWEVIRLTYSRGPYLGTSGKSLGISDSVLLLLRGPVVDGDHLWGVASWRDGKSDWAWTVQSKQITHVGVKSLTNLMKEAADGQD